jgi:membrane-associated protease RseP (regulator of RpoE activity)
MRDKLKYILICILAFVIFVFTAITVHEFGHFIVAKAFDFKIDTFAIGVCWPESWGKVSFLNNPIISWDSGDTFYELNPLPIAGYVGFNPEDVQHHPLENLLVATAGPMMNFVWMAVTFILLIRMEMKGSIKKEDYQIKPYEKYAKRSLIGPIGIADILGYSLQQGFLPFAHQLAMMNLSIGVLNLLPIMPLDGHHVVRNIALMTPWPTTVYLVMIALFWAYFFGLFSRKSPS